MITFLSSPKSFIGHAGKIQKNAIFSWLAVHPDVEVIIYGDGEAVAESCREMGVLHVPEVPCSDSGVPFFNGIVNHAKEHARHDMQCYVNCDIILSPRIINALSCLHFPKYLVVGQRIDLSEGATFDITLSWVEQIAQLSQDGLATLHPTSAMDYFVFTRGMWDGLLPLIIGRGGYDGALVAFCLRNNIPLIDGTYSIPALHQFHDYGHVIGEKKEVMRGKEAMQNLKLHRIKHSIPDTADAEWQIRDGKLQLSLCRGDWLRRREITLRFKKGFENTGLILRFFWRILVACNYKIKHIDIKNLIND